MNLDDDTLAGALQLYAEKRFGVLSTLSVHLEGTPFGSVATYALDYNGHPLTLISSIAQHTKNVSNDARCSLTILQNHGGNVQAESRLTISGQLVPAGDDNSCIARYERYFPQSARYRKAHDFKLYRLRPKAVRYIGGFGKIHWIEPEKFFLPSPFDMESEGYILNHMNADHKDSLRSYLAHYKSITIATDTPVAMCGIDANGFDVNVGTHNYRFHSPRRITNSKVAREVLVEMSKEADTTD